VDALGVVTHQQEHLGRGAGSHSVCFQQLGGAVGRQYLELGIVLLDFGIQK